MLSIQDLGIQIMGNIPNKLYILGGEEFGIKEKYIEQMTKFYGEKVEAEAAGPIIDMMCRKHLIAPNPALYVVRYDEQFITDLNDVYATKVLNANIIGTLVLLYENPKHVAKCDKYLPGNTAEIGQVDRKLVIKYLHSDFPKLDDRCIEIAADYGTSYGHSRKICSLMDKADPAILARMSESHVAELFGCTTSSSEMQIQIGVASKNFAMLSHLIEKYPDDPDRVVYAILQTMIELDKIRSTKYSDSPIKEYAKMWTPQDIYYMFMNAYSELQKLRSMSSYEVESSLIYLIGLLKFQPIPSPEVMM